MESSKKKKTSSTRKLAQADAKLVSSPIATGGSGTFFEQHVNATFLCLLLSGAIPPIFVNTTIEEVSFQTERLGWQTDDILLQCRGKQGATRKLAIQVKRTFTVSRNDKECTKAFTDFWQDFHNRTLFARDNDAFALVVLRGTDVLLGQLGALLECARASKSQIDFETRLTTKGFLKAGVKGFYDEIEAIISSVPGVPFLKEDYWVFLRAFHIVSFDLNTPTKLTEGSIKSLLAFTASGPDRIGQAEQTWTTMLEIVGAGMPQAAIFTRASLPAELQQRHSSIGGENTEVIKKLKEHSVVTLRAIRTDLANRVSLARDEAMTVALEKLTESRMLLISGPAGSGKSAVAKRVLDELSKSSLVLSFRAEEFSAAHLDQAFLQAQIPANAETINSVLAGQGRKILFLDSAERVLEAPTRGAFVDLLEFVRNDNSWHVVITCRDYSVDIVRASFLDALGFPIAHYGVPELTDGELDEVIKAIPDLARPASVPFLRSLFRNPYILDKAARMQWPPDGSLPSDERSFRRKFWHDLVRRDEEAMAGLPLRRQETFGDLCVRRAKALQPYASTAGLDPQVLSVLEKDSIVTFDETKTLAAPTHDILEDWAVVEWITTQFAAHQTNIQEFAKALASYPAIRRGYRKWLRELLELEAPVADTYVLSVLGDGSVPKYFKDDTLIAVMQSTIASNFFDRNKRLLTENDCALLVRIIHLVRVACKTTPPHAPIDLAPSWFIPHGNAWPTVLRAIRENFPSLVTPYLALLVGFISDWASGISWWERYPAGAEDAVHIAGELLPYLDEYNHEEHLKDALIVIIKAPKAGVALFESLAARALLREKTDHAADKFGELILTAIESSPACRDMPKSVIPIIESRILEVPNKRFEYRGSMMRVEEAFGVEEHFHREFIPASALSGPFASLLRSNPEETIPFLIGLWNKVSDCYKARSQVLQLEPLEAIALTFPSGRVVTQQGNARFWNLYRGTTVGPNVLQCSLMALEAWLLEYGKVAEEGALDSVLLTLLLGNNNIAMTAVAASVATAFPRAAPKTGLTLLSSKELIFLDRHRMVHERTSGFSSSLYDALQQMYDDERKKSGALAHRKFDLEMLAFQLQFGAEKEKVWAILDRHQAALPPAEKQTEEDRLWRLSLHRMDTRRFTPTVQKVETSEVTSEGKEEKRTKSLIVFTPNNLEPDLQEIVDEHAPDAEAFNNRTSLWVWGHKAHSREQGSGLNWRVYLAKAQELEPSESASPEPKIILDGTNLVAAVCVRDHWGELTEAERQWCERRLIEALTSDTVVGDAYFRGGGADDGECAAAFVVPRLLNEPGSDERRQRILKAIVASITHSSEKVVAHAVSGIGTYLQSTDQPLILAVLKVLAQIATRVSELYATEEQLPYNNRQSIGAIYRAVQLDFRSKARLDLPCTSHDLEGVSLNDWYGFKIYGEILRIMFHVNDRTLVVPAFRRMAEQLAAWWTEDRENIRGRRSDDDEIVAMQLTARFLVTSTIEDARPLCEVLAGISDKAPRQLGWFVKELASVADRQDDASGFWPVWQIFADKIANASWLTKLGSRHSPDNGLLEAMFIGLSWKKGVRHWHVLESGDSKIEQLFTKLPAAPIVFRVFSKFLFDIGEKSLPNAFILLSERLKTGSASKILTDKSTPFYLENLLKRFIYGRPDLLKTTSRLREAVLHLLDELVEAGSSSAYRMRDDFVTPRPSA